MVAVQNYLWNIKMEKTKYISSDNINSDTPEKPSNRRGLQRAMHFGGSAVHLKFLP